MKKIFKWTMPVLAGALLLSSCSTDEVDPAVVPGIGSNLVYINLGQTMGTQQINTVETGAASVSVTGVEPDLTPLAVAANGTRQLEFRLKCTRPAEKDIIVKLSKGDLPEGYLEIPNALALLNKTEFTIPKGETLSADTVKIAPIPDADLMNLSQVGIYMFPFKIESVSGSAKPSSNMGSGYYIFDFSLVANARAATASGAVINPKPTGDGAWSVTATRGNGDAHTLTNPDRMLDDNTATSSYTTTGSVSGAGVLPLMMDFDLKQAYTDMTGFRLATTGNNYRLTRANVYTREAETDDWVFQGALTFANNNNHNVAFYSPVTARFIRCEIAAVQSGGNGLRIADFNIYQ